MAWIGTPGTGQSAAVGSTSIATAWGTGQNRVAGRSLFACAVLTNSANSVPTCSTPAGWVLDHSFSGGASTVRTACFIFRLPVAAGGDAAPSFTVSAGANAVGIIDLFEWDEAVTVDVLYAGASTSSIGAIATGSATTTNAADMILALMGGRGATTDTWGSPITSEIAAASPNIGGTALGIGVGTANLVATRTGTVADTTAGTANVKSLIAVAYVRGTTISGSVPDRWGAVTGF